ncbi:UNVERIFIED_CONTAM: Origin of replication complex subunit [Sesamum radiatum]|uniref:Origin of replication complex subunit 4 n=1 Tax=Sesamum radiatum TaxID=300843 RepID=A0AAW2JST6_SESRA
MGRLNPAEQAKIILRSRISSPSFVFSFFSQSPDSNYSKLKYIISSSVTEACNNSVLLLGPRGCGKVAVLEIVLEELLKEHPDMISVIRLNGLLHCDNNCALKVELPILPPCCYTDCMNILEIARQLCLEHHLMFSKMASYDDNSQFLLSMLRECGLAHKTIVFVLDEFDLFTQGKQRLLYSLLDAMQSITSQAVVVGVSCRLDADQLLEKRVRSRFSHRKLLFLPPSREDLQSDMMIATRFSAICHMDMNSGFLSVENFKSALPSIQRQPKLEALKDCSVLELYILVCMKRLEVKELELCNFNSIMKEYKSIHDTFQTSDYYARNVCLRAFEHLLDRALISFEDNKGHGQSAEFRAVKLLISWHELHQGLKSHRSCPLSHAILTSKCASVAVA